MSGLTVTISGTAVVCCVHDRVKREWVDVDKFTCALRDVGADPRQIQVHTCSCCENLFASTDDTPRFCQHCQGHAVHPLGGPLPDPIGVI